MQVPAAMFIESAKEMVDKLDPAVRADQRKELHVAVGHKSDDFAAGYELGLQTGRVVLAMEAGKNL